LLIALLQSFFNLNQSSTISLSSTKQGFNSIGAISDLFLFLSVFKAPCITLEPSEPDSYDFITLLQVLVLITEEKVEEKIENVMGVMGGGGGSGNSGSGSVGKDEFVNVF
jgi:hypothetical protein